MTADAKEYTAGIDIETNHDEGAGALGCFARDKNGKTVLLSCSHVLFPAFEVIDDLRVFQPNYSSCCSSGDPIARPVFDAKTKAKEIIKDVEWVGGYHDGKWFGGFDSVPAKIGSNFMGATDPSGHASQVDCAIAVLDPGIKFRNVWRFKVGDQVQEVPLVGAVTEGLGVGKGPDLGTAPSAAQYVRVYSTSAGKLMFGTLLSTPPADIPHVDDPDKIIYRWGISDSSDAGMGIKTSVNQFLILPRPTPVDGVSYEDSYRNGERLTFDHGDSGSVVINHQNRIIGMIIRKYDLDKIMAVDRSFMEFADIGSIAIATPIQKILEHLEITIPDAATGFAGTVPSQGAVTRVFVSGFTADSELAALRGAVEDLRNQLLARRRGRFLLGKIGQHRREVKRLLASVRAISVAWHDLGGAAFYNHCVRSARDASHVIPTSINGVSRERLFNTLVPLFARYGSAALRRDIERYRGWAAGTLLRAATLADVPEQVGRRCTPP